MPSKRSSVMRTSTQNGESDDEDGDESSSGSEDDDPMAAASNSEAASASGLDQEQVRHITLGISDTSSNNSLARGIGSAAVATAAASSSVASSTATETPPLPSRNIGPPPSRPPVTSPSRQNSR